MAAIACSSVATRSENCRDSEAATYLKLISIGLVFITSIIGIGSPVILARIFHGQSVYEKAILLIKCFAAGVILSTSLVHVLPDAFDAISDCQVASFRPWKDFPFAGFVVLVGALLALFVDLSATSHVHSSRSAYTPLEGRDEAKGDIGLKSVEMSVEHGIKIGGVDDVEKMKQRLVSQVLEIGIIFHSVIIGVTMGMSQNQCTIRPLVAALSFHQIFEGMGLGGCIAQADFKMGTVMYMGFMFSATTPLGILLGMVVFYITGYDDSSRHALIVEGMLGSLSSGILIYMALVDLVAVDFFHNKAMTSNPHLRRVSYISLISGSAAMSVLALWA